MKDEKEAFVLIKKFKDDNNLSWNKVARKIYEHTSASNGKAKYIKCDEIKDFGNRLSKAMQRKKQRKIKIINDVSLSFEDIVNILYPYQDSPISEEDIEKYRLFNIKILQEADYDWSIFEQGELQKIESKMPIESVETLTILGHYYYYRGKNGIRNVKRAIELYKKSAELDDEIALYQLGIIYEYGDNEEIKQDLVSAFQYYRKASKKELSLAFNKLAICYYQGIGTNKNLELFFENASQSAKLGDIEGKLMLAFAYHYGEGTEKNIGDAIKIYEEIVNEPSKYLAPAYMMLADLCREKDFEQAKTYLIRYHEIYLDLIIKCKNFDTLEPIFQAMKITPNKLNEIFKSSHYDYVAKPSKLTVISKLFG